MKIEKVNLSFRNPLEPIKKVDTLVLHHPAHPSWGLEEIHDYHKKSKGWSGIGYNYFITFDGRVFEGRGKNVGAHCSGHNNHSLGICFQGDFDKQQMTDKQVESGGWLIATLLREYGLDINDVVGHKDMPGASTACPGKNFRMKDVKQSTLEYTNPNVKKAATNKKIKTGGLTPDGVKAVTEYFLEKGWYAEILFNPKQGNPKALTGGLNAAMQAEFEAWCKNRNWSYTIVD